jgi:hypothetical protein
MPQFNVDEDLAALVEKLAKPRPFEKLTFNAALRRVLLGRLRFQTKMANWMNLRSYSQSLWPYVKMPRKKHRPRALVSGRQTCLS